MKILLVDMGYMARRAFYVVGHLRHEGEATGVAFGVLRDVENIREKFAADRVVLAFDSRNNLRKKILPTYKSSRNQGMTEEKIETRRLLYYQIDRLKSDILHRMGYSNIFEVDGYEADDIIAKIAFDLPLMDEAVIVSSDGDLLQCIRPNVIIYNPARQEVTTWQSFKSTWGIDPIRWADVKALTGCSTDDVPGISGVGQVTAVMWLMDKIGMTSKKRLLVENNLLIYKRNLPLVRLPFEGIEVPEIREDNVTEAKRMEMQEELGIRPKRVRSNSTSKEDNKEKEEAQGFW